MEKFLDKGVVENLIILSNRVSEAEETFDKAVAQQEEKILTAFEQYHLILYEKPVDKMFYFCCINIESINDKVVTICVSDREDQYSSDYYRMPVEFLFDPDSLSISIKKELDDKKKKELVKKKEVLNKNINLLKYKCNTLKKEKEELEKSLENLND